MAKAEGRRRRAARGQRVALQCHGAIGYTTEYDLHLYMKRAWALARQLGRRALAPRPASAARSCRPDRTRSDPMPEAYIVDAVRSPVGRRNGGARRRPPGRSRRALDPRAHGPGRRRSGRGRRRRVRLRRHDRPAGRRHRAHVLARRRAPRRGAGHDRRPPVRLVAAGRALRRAGRDVGHRRPRRRGRRAEHERDPDQRGDARRRAVRLREPVRRVAGLGGALRHARGVAVPQPPR